MKLHLGCYQKKIHGFINIDVREDVQPDVVDDVFTLKTQKENSAELIYACHVLEHATFSEAQIALKRWFDVLQPKGTIRLAVPDMEAVFDYYNQTKNLTELRAFLYGSQRHDYDLHYAGWDFLNLKKDLEAVGFKDVRRYDWRLTEHFYIDDYSQCYLPKIAYKTRRPNDIIEGKLMSLNVEATKP
jgi:predicted SAM-dependent methyltransferase